jgi:hypothetical protein
MSASVMHGNSLACASLTGRYYLKIWPLFKRIRLNGYGTENHAEIMLEHRELKMVLILSWVADKFDEPLKYYAVHIREGKVLSHLPEDRCSPRPIVVYAATTLRHHSSALIMTRASRLYHVVHAQMTLIRRIWLECKVFSFAFSNLSKFTDIESDIKRKTVEREI